MSKKHDIIWLESVDSTNEEAKRHISDIDNLSVLSALEQTAGRGQRGNKWTSNTGENLMFSIVLKDPKICARDQFVLNEIASLSVVDFLSMHGISARIKWPNDIYVGSKKICGILIENSLHGSAISSSIIGIGLNINQRNFNINLPNPTSMLLCRAEDGPFDIHRCLEEFMDIFTSLHDRFLTSACDLSPLRQRYLSSLWRLGEPSLFIDYTFLPGGHLEGPMNICTEKAPDTGISSSDQTGNEFPGIIRGLSPTGNLLVEDFSTGLTREFGFKEIGYIL
jgi:BirA family biotin operon repressor/biotin-[acetyl-CoA-carboxylase] ligase